MRVPIEDRLDIQEVSARYAFRCDTKLYDQVGELFTEDGVFDETVVGLPLCETRAGIHEFFCSMKDSSLEFIIHINSNHQITEFSGDTASGTSHLHAMGHFLGNPIEILGYYSDDYAKVDGTWLLRKRLLVEITPSTGFNVGSGAEAGR
jgi:hypothetical protein